MAGRSSPSAVPTITSGFVGVSRRLDANQARRLKKSRRPARVAGEVGIEVAVGEWLGSVTHPYPEKTVHLRARIYPLRLAPARTARLGCHACAWAGAAAQLSEDAFPPADETLLRAARLQPAELWE
jgi:hypothetical protein